MNRAAILRLVVGAGALLLALLVGVLPGWLGLEGGSAWLLRVGLWVLLVVAAVLLVRLLAPPEAPALRGDDPLVVAFRSARERLAALTRGSGGRAAFDALPVTLLVGPRFTTKTTLVANSGLDPELLAGEVYRGDQVAPTEVVNLWYAGETVWVEAGGALLEDPLRWERLGRLLKPRRLGAVLGRGGQPPRQVVVCLSCEAFQAPGAAESVPATGRALRDRLADLSSQLGIRLPVYVLFTRADRIPHFPGFVQGMTREEVRDLLGAALPVQPRPDPGTHGEREGARVAAAFDGIVRRLAERRLLLLPRSGAAAGSAYEFPREIRKLSGLATSFLVELCRPGQRAVGPFLRGFWFVGVRPVLVDAPAPLPQASAPSTGGGMDATRVFRLQDLQGFQSAPAAQATAGTGRRVPQWVFHERIFRDVLLGDVVGRAITGGGATVDLLRRTALGGAAASLLALLALSTFSFFGNRGLQREARVALEGVARLESSEPELASLDDLRRLEALRQLGVRLREYEIGRPPLGLRMGLYRGSEVFREVRAGYFQALDRVALGRVHQILGAELSSLPDAPDAASEYGRTYASLKAYLITTEHPERSTPDFLSPVLLDRWVGARSNGADGEWGELARRQLDFYATELALEDPYRRALDAGAVVRARAYLNQFAGVDRFYQALVGAASEGNEPVRFGRIYPGSESILQNPHEVPGAFTEGGWSVVQESLADIDRLLGQESWVVGDQALAAVDRARLAEEIRALYLRDYRSQWERFLGAGRVTLGPMGQAGESLLRLGGNQSPVLQMLHLAARNTDVDSTVAAAFQPLHQVTPPEIRDRLVSDGNRPWVDAVSALAQVVTRMAAPNPEPGLDSQGRAAVGDARAVVQQISRSFSIAPEAQGVARSVTQLLEAPIQLAGRLVDAGPARELAGAGASFCASFQPFLRKYPFVQGSMDESTPEDIAAAFLPGGSLLWGFYDGPVREVLVRQGTRYGPRPGAPTALNPAFVEFFNRSVQVSRAFFGDEASPRPEASIQMQLRLETSDALEEITLIVDGRSETFTRTQQNFRTVAWNARSREVRVTGLVGGNRIPLVEVPQGTWSLFRFLQAAAWQPRGGNSFTLEWPETRAGVRLRGQVTLPPQVEPVMRPGHFQGYQCVAQVAR